MRKLLETRIKELQKHIKDEKLSGFLVLTPANRLYLSGFSGSAGSVLITPRAAMLFVDGRYIERARVESWIPVQDVADLESVMRRYQGKKIGVEDTLTIRELKKLKTCYLGVLWRVTRNVVEEVRQQKSKDELRIMRRASRIIDDAFSFVRKVISQKLKAELTEIELAHAIQDLGRERGAEGVPFEPIVAWARNAASPHHASSAQKIGTNNFLLLDFGFTFDGYQSDFTRTLFIGQSTAKQREVYEVVLEAQRRAIESVRENVKTSEVDKAARSFIAEQGYGDYFTHTTGHGVGLEIHESPTLSTSSSEVLKAGSVVTIEPGIYLPHKYGVRIEDMVVVERKPKIFSTIPKDWDSMVMAR